MYTETLCLTFLCEPAPVMFFAPPLCLGGWMPQWEPFISKDRCCHAHAFLSMRVSVRCPFFNLMGKPHFLFCHPVNRHTHPTHTQIHTLWTLCHSQFPSSSVTVSHLKWVTSHRLLGDLPGRRGSGKVLLFRHCPTVRLREGDPHMRIHIVNIYMWT